MMKNINEYKKSQSIVKLMSELDKGKRSGNEKGWIDAAKVEKELGTTSEKPFSEDKR